MTRRALLWSVVFTLALTTSIAAAEDSPDVPVELTAVAGAPCEMEGWAGSRRTSQLVLVRGVEGVGGPTTAVDAHIVFARVDATRQRASVAKDGSFRAFAMIMREERASCQGGQFVVERVVRALPEIEVHASGCAKEILRLKAEESWLDIQLQCGVARRAA